jgi:uncharacterized protein YjbJ (UPF0337 family)
VIGDVGTHVVTTTFREGPGREKHEHFINPKECAVGVDDRIKHEVDEGVGKAKEAVGRATDNERLEAEGRAEQAEANVKQAGDHVREAVEDAKDALRPER